MSVNHTFHPQLTIIYWQSSMMKKNSSKMQRNLLILNLHSFLLLIISFFERNLENEENFISTYYLEYHDIDAISDVANTIVKKDKIRQAGFAHMNLFCADKPKFVLPHTEKIIILEVSDERSPQSINQYCQKMRQDISRKGVVMNNFVSISLLEKLK